MSKRSLGSSGEVAVAVLLLLAALGVDLLWFRPQENRLRALVVQKQQLEEAAARDRAHEEQAGEILGYVEGPGGPAGDWKAPYRSADPLSLLERLRTQAGLARMGLNLEGKESGNPFTRTTYFMALYGSFDDQIRFLKSLEEARPLVRVDAFTMDTGMQDPKVSLKLNITVLTLAGEGSS